MPQESTESELIRLSDYSSVFWDPEKILEMVIDDHLHDMEKIVVIFKDKDGFISGYISSMRNTEAIGIVEIFKKYLIDDTN